MKMSGNEIFEAAALAQLRNQAGKANFRAIALCPQISSYWMNRALCYYKLKNWVLVEGDCRRAIHLDNTIVKAHHMLGVALLRRREYAEGIRELEKALDLARGIYPNFDMVMLIECDLAGGKYLGGQMQLVRIHKKLHNLREACVSALQVEGFLDEVEALEDVFRRAAEDDMPTEVPDYLCCAITRGVFKDPVITPYGHTYEKEAIIRHLERVESLRAVVNCLI